MKSLSCWIIDADRAQRCAPTRHAREPPAEILQAGKSQSRFQLLLTVGCTSRLDHARQAPQLRADKSRRTLSHPARAHRWHWASGWPWSASISVFLQTHTNKIHAARSHPATPHQEQVKSGSVIDVRFTPDATKLLRSSAMTRCAKTSALQQTALYSITSSVWTSHHSMNCALMSHMG